MQIRALQKWEREREGRFSANEITTPFNSFSRKGIKFNPAQAGVFSSKATSIMINNSACIRDVIVTEWDKKNAENGEQ